MTKTAVLSDDPLIMAVRKALKEIESRPTPTETMVNVIMIDGREWARHTGWKCPVCEAYCRRDDRTVRRRHSHETIVDYSGYNMHFAHSHATPFYREQRVIDIVKKSLTGL